MEAYKIAGGALAGIGAVAALPIMGPIGAVSVIGAIVGGTLGGVAGAVVSEMEEDQDWNRSSALEGEEEVCDEMDDDPNPWLLAVEKLEGNLDEDSFGGLIVALHVMERAAGRVRDIGIPGWMQDIREMVVQLEVPEKAEQEIEQLNQTTVTLQQVVAKVQQLTEEAKVQVAQLLNELIPVEEPSESVSKPFLRTRTVNATEVVELVRSLVQ